MKFLANYFCLVFCGIKMFKLKFLFILTFIQSRNCKKTVFFKYNTQYFNVFIVFVVILSIFVNYIDKTIDFLSKLSFCIWFHRDTIVNMLVFSLFDVYFVNLTKDNNNKTLYNLYLIINSRFFIKITLKLTVFQQKTNIFYVKSLLLNKTNSIVNTNIQKTTYFFNKIKNYQF